MAISKSIQDKQTNILLKVAYNEIQQLTGKLSKTSFADILNRKKQNIGRRMGYDGLLLIDEAKLLLKYLENEGKIDNNFYAKLNQIVNPAKSDNEIKTIQSFVASENDNFAELNVRGVVDISCGYGTSIYNDNVTGKCKVPRKTLRDYGASISMTEIVYAQGDSMSPEIESGDALLVDTSQTEIINGVVYAFNYEGQPMCKRLQKIGNEIKAISKNSDYDPFFIDFNNQFNIIGRVVGLMRPVI